MRHSLQITAATFLMLLANEASAQGPAFRPGPSGGGSGGGFNNGPAVSPYLNLLRRGSPAVNYYGLVRPAIDTQNSLNTLQQQVSDFAAPGTGFGSVDPLSPLVTGGNRVRFLNTGNYFLYGVQPGNLSGRSFGGGGGSGGNFTANAGQGAGGQGNRSSTQPTTSAPRR